MVKISKKRGTRGGNDTRKARVAYKKRMLGLMRNTRPFNKRSANQLCRTINGEEVVKSLKRTKKDHWTAHLSEPAIASLDVPCTSSQNPQPPIKMIFSRVFRDDHWTADSVEPAMASLDGPQTPIRTIFRRKKDDWQKDARPIALERVRKSCARTSNAMSLLMTKMRDENLKSKTKLRDFGFTYAFDGATDLEGKSFDGGPRIADTVRQQDVRQECSPDKCQGCDLTYYDCIGKILPLIKSDPGEADRLARDIFRSHGVLPQAVYCPVERCKGNACKIVTESSGKDKVRLVWKCRKTYSVKTPDGKKQSKRCTFSVADNSGTILEYSNIRASLVLLLMNAWCRKTFEQETLAVQLGLTEATVCHWKKKFDIMCLKAVRRPDFENVIGGPGIVVELDETIVSRQKMKMGNKKARLRNNMWVFGGCERHGNRRFFVPLLKTIKSVDGDGYTKEIPRTSSNLLPLVEKYVAPGSIIMTDKWKSYHGIPKYPARHPDNEHLICPDPLKFTHYDVNHGVEYVRKDEPFVHINGVERMWRDMKEWMSRPGQKRLYLKQYLARYQILLGFPDKKFTQKGVKKVRVKGYTKRLHNSLLAAGRIFKHKSE